MRAALIATLAMDERAFAVLEGLRRRHFPVERNLVPAHVTLFHKLPGDHEDRIREQLAVVCAATARFDLAVGGIRRLGGGVAINVEGEGLLKIRDALRRLWVDWLGPQDRQGYRPHVTVQNKADPSAAETLALSLEKDFTGISVEARGLILWRYLGGPWEHIETFAFGTGLSPQEIEGVI